MKMMKIVVYVVMLMAAAMQGGCASVGWDPGLQSRAQQAVDSARQSAPALDRFFQHAYGYAIFPEVYKGGLVMLGGAHGTGYVYELNTLVGTSRITQVNVGPQLGGQSFTEVVFFKGKEDLDNFKRGNFELNAQATAILVTSGMATNTDYSNGVAIFAIPKAGVMAEASIGGQKFSYTPL